MLNRPLWPRVGFQWKEPRAFVRLRDARERAATPWWLVPLMALLYAGMILLRWYVDSHFAGKDVGSFHDALVRCGWGGPLLVGMIVGLNRVCPAYVELGRSHLVRSRSNHRRQTAYKDLRSFTWRTEGGCTTLVFTERSRNREIVLAVPEEINLGEVSLFLLDRQVQPRSPVEGAAA